MAEVSQQNLIEVPHIEFEEQLPNCLGADTTRNTDRQM
jgi:hypothetical protein